MALTTPTPSRGGHGDKGRTHCSVEFCFYSTAAATLAQLDVCISEAIRRVVNL